MVEEKYLVYIDILGFSNLVHKDYSIIRKLFDCIDNLNVHRHDAFQTVVFSDTILIFNKIKPVSSGDHQYLVMFACEFVQNLLLRSVDLHIQFRAILTYGEFYYERLENIEAYYGGALVKSYNKEKEINAHGLFIDVKLLEHNIVFPTAQFDKDLHFVYLTQTLDRLNYYEFDSSPLDPFFVDEALEFVNLRREVKILKVLRSNIDTQMDSKIRGKYLQTYFFYKLRYGRLIEIFENNNFDHKIISPDANWTSFD